MSEHAKHFGGTTARTSCPQRRRFEMDRAEAQAARRVRQTLDRLYSELVNQTMPLVEGWWLIPH
jgi:hypothetical protein